MIKKLMLSILLLSSSLLAEKAILLDIISENILKVQHKGKVERIHLTGIELFSKANNATKNIDLKTKEEFKKETLAYLANHLKVGSEIKYAIISKAGIKKVWLDKNELNYRIIRDGYALIDLNDPFLPTSFKMRMSIAMKYAKDRKIGIWGKKEKELLALIDTNKHMCGWKHRKNATGITKLAILKEHQNALPKSARVKEIRYLAMLNSAINQ